MWFPLLFGSLTLTLFHLHFPFSFWSNLLCSPNSNSVLFFLNHVSPLNSVNSCVLMFLLELLINFPLENYFCFVIDQSDWITDNFQEIMLSRSRLSIENPLVLLKISCFSCTNRPPCNFNRLSPLAVTRKISFDTWPSNFLTTQQRFITTWCVRSHCFLFLTWKIYMMTKKNTNRISKTCTSISIRDLKIHRWPFLIGAKFNHKSNDTWSGGWFSKNCNESSTHYFFEDFCFFF